MGDALRLLWDFDDLDATEERFRALLAREDLEPRRRADVLSQLARVEGLRGRFDEGERLVDEAQALAGFATSCVLLERGRLRRSAGDREAALPLFESAFEAAVSEADGFLAADAAHMAALAASDREGMAAWTRRGVALAEAADEPEVTYWLGPLLNNLGWDHYRAGEYVDALAAFERALDARERDAERPYEAEIARYAVAKALRMLDRAAEASVLLEQAVAWTEEAGRPDGWFHEELAESYAAIGRADDARQHAAIALELLPGSDPSFETDRDRVARLERLAG